MIREKSRSKREISTYYNMKHEDKPLEFKEESLTDQSYFYENDIKTLVKNGMVEPGTRLVYGVQDMSSLDELKNAELEYKRVWNTLTKEQKSEFRDFGDFVVQASDINNYRPQVLPEVEKEEEVEKVEE